LVLIALLLVGAPSLLLILWLLLVLRLVNRTTGLPAKTLDSLGVLGLGAWLNWQGYWMVGLVTSVAFLLDGLLPPPLRRQLFASGLAFLATVILSTFHGEMAMETGPTMPVVISSVMMAALFLVVIVTSGDVQAVGDATREPLIPRRVRTAQVLALLIALLFAWWDGASGVVALLPLWAAMIGVGLYRLAILFLQRRR
jgi:hypothetical protein